MDIDRSFPNEQPRDHRQAGAAALGCPQRLRPGRDAVAADRTEKQRRLWLDEHGKQDIDGGRV
ncbi:MAG TPA: hypothetical protein VLE94_02060 [Burkholderiaceae bacterium]|nr:hypothetical protein [Burkholderiaceae bacterium]HSC01271.1 hypothetical protein [Burkholderiaceae bacterium]